MLPDPDLMAAELLRDALPSVTVETQLSDKALSGDDYVWVHTVGGSTPTVDQIDAPSVEVVVYSDTRADAAQLTRRVQQVFYNAWASQTVTSHGYIARFSTSLRGTEQRVDGQPAGIFRFTALYELVTRPSN